MNKHYYQLNASSHVWTVKDKKIKNLLSSYSVDEETMCYEIERNVSSKRIMKMLSDYGLGAWRFVYSNKKDNQYGIACYSRARILINVIKDLEHFKEYALAHNYNDALEWLREDYNWPV